MILNKTIKIALLSTLILFVLSCKQFQNEAVHNIETTSKKNINEDSKILSLSNQLYLLAPEFDSENCKSFGECDCCSSNYLFLDDENFICVDYCLDTDTYYSGKYKIENDTVNLKFNSTVVQKEYNWESETDTINKQPKYLYKIEKCKALQTVWIKLNCNKNNCFKKIGDETEFASIDNKKSSENFLNELKKEGLIEKLNLK